MRFLDLFAAAILWQSALLVNIGAPASPGHLRYQRALVLPAGGGGPVCAVLDAQTLAHTGSAAHNDLRIYAGYPGSLAQAETPYLLTESGPEPVADAEVRAEHVRRAGGGLEFDLHMPDRAYSELQLELRARDFVGTVIVAAGGEGARRVPLGSFGIFDLSREGLGRWTVLPMAETSDPVLHVQLTLRTPEGEPITPLPTELVTGASVPPSRERQTLYTPVARTGITVRQGSTTVATFEVPAHVPVERVGFTLPPGFVQNFDREVRVRARPDRDPAAETEVVDAGAIQQVRLPSGDPRLNPIDVRQLQLDATLGTMLTGSATVHVAVQNRNLPPLPIGVVTLEMRQRELCFLAQPGAQYTLRYGDPTLGAPLYDSAALLRLAQAPPRAQSLRADRPLEATLGPEQRNPHWEPRRDTRPYLDRHPGLFWLVVVICGGMMGASALHYVQYRGARS